MTAAIVDLGDAHPYPAITAAWRAGAATWFRVSEGRAMAALEVVPPRYVSGTPRGSFLMGECAAHDARGVAVYTAFVRLSALGSVAGHQAGGHYYARNVAIDQVAAAVDELRAALTPPPEGRTAPLLTAALDHLRTYGWRQHGNGEAGAPCCARGALMVAADAAGVRMTSLYHDAQDRLLGAIARYLGVRFDDASAVEFNDAAGREFGDIEAVFEDAIKADTPR